MVIPNHVPNFLYDIFGTHEPTLAWRGSGNLAIGDVAAFPLDFAASALSNPTATPALTSSSVHPYYNLTTMTAGNTQLGFLAVALQAITAGTGAYGKFCVFSADVLVKVSQGTGVTGAAGDWLAAHTDMTAAFAVTAGQLFTQTKALLDGAIVPSLCYGRALEASTGSAATKRCFFSGCGIFAFGGGG